MLKTFSLRLTCRGRGEGLVWSTPGVLPALAGVVHDRQSADYEHGHGEND
jgi:hypothetical protein